MKDPTEQQIIRNIQITLEAAGVKATAEAVGTVKRELDKVREAANKLQDATFNLHKEMQKQADIYAEAQKKAESSLKEQRKQVAQTAKSLINIGGVASSAMGDISSGLKKIAGLGGFGMMVSQAVNLEKSLLGVAVSTNRLGMSITSIESKLSNLGQSLHLTRVETIGLFSEFSKTQKFVSLTSFQKLLERIHTMVGANKEAIQGLMSAVGGLSQKYAGLAEAIKNINGITSKQEKSRLATRLKLLYLTQEIGQEEYRNLIALVRGHEHVNKQDRERQKIAQRRIKTVQQFQRQIENVSVRIGNHLLPILERVADWLDKITDYGDKWYKQVLAIAALYGTINLGSSLMRVGMKGLATAGSHAIAHRIGGATASQAAVFGVGTAARTMPLGVGGLLIAGGVLTTAAGDLGYQKLREKAYKKGKRGEGNLGTETAAVATGIAGYTAGGAAIGGGAGLIIGSLFGGVGAVPGLIIGTKIGGAIGTLVGAIRTTFGDIKFKERMEKLDNFARTYRQEKKAQVQAEKKYSDNIEMHRQAGLQEAATEGMSAAGRANIMAQAKKFEIKAAETETKLYKDTDYGTKEQFEANLKASKEDVGTEKEIFNKIQSDLENLKAKKQDGEKVDDDILKGTEQSLEEQRKKLKEVEEQAEKLRDIQAEIQSEIEKTQPEMVKWRTASNALVENFHELGKTIEKFKAIGDTGFSEMLAMSQKMQLSGLIDFGALDKNAEEARSGFEQEAESISQWLNLVKDLRRGTEENDKGKTIKQLVEEGKLTEKQANYFKDQDSSLNDILNNQAKINEKEARYSAISSEISQILRARVDVQKGHLEQQGAMAQQAGLMVQIADNYAISVRASAQMRMREYGALKDQVSILKEQENTLRSQIADPENASQRLSLNKQLLDIQNEQLQIQLKMGGIAKTLRDGWVEAIGSMNTGAGTFTKIIMDQQKGTAQALITAQDAAVISSVSGSLSEGYRGSEKFTTQQGMSGGSIIGGSFGRRAQAYQTTMDRITGDSAEALQYRNREMMQQSLAKKINMGATGGMHAASFGGSKHYEGIVGQYGATTSLGAGNVITSPSSNIASPVGSSGTFSNINVNVRLQSNAKKVASEISSAIAGEVSSIVNGSISQFGHQTLR